MKSLIIGAGQIGTSLHRVIGGKMHDKTIINDSFDIIHICFPYSKKFIKEVRKYQRAYNPKYTVIHSTAPVGTSTKLGAYHSPVRGVHPNLSESIKTFVKYLAPKSKELKEYFEGFGINIVEMDKPEETEALKIWSTTYYGWNIMFNKILYKWCKKNNLDFNKIYTESNKTYNEGYKKMGMDNVIRPVLKYMKGKIGGHCIIPNCKLIKNKITKFILKNNE